MYVNKVAQEAPPKIWSGWPNWLVLAVLNVHF